MAQSPDHPELLFVEAAGFTKGRPDGPPLWIVVHDMEAGESSIRAESTAAYFASGAGGRDVSAHYCVDDNSVVQCVRLADSAWTVGNRQGNNRGINWELSGFARQTRAEWLDEFGLAMFAQMAPIVRADAAKYGIPLQRRTVAELRNLRPGVTSHNELRLAFGGTDHTDPGPNFPWDVFLQILTAEPEQEADVANVYKTETGEWWVSNGIHRRGPIRTKSPAFAQATTGMTVVELSESQREALGYATWDAYLDAVAGPVFPAPPVLTFEHTHGAITTVGAAGLVATP